MAEDRMAKFKESDDKIVSAAKKRTQELKEQADKARHEDGIRTGSVAGKDDHTLTDGNDPQPPRED